MSPARRMRFLQMTAIALESVINDYNINGLDLFWEILYM